MMEMADARPDAAWFQRVGQAWDEWQKREETPRAAWRWGFSTRVLRHVNRLICGRALPAWSDGMIARIREARGGGLPLGRGCSIGCGDGSKEMELLKAGVVEHFFLFELSEERARQGQCLAAQAGLTERVHYVPGNAFDQRHEPYDLVLWNNALHHMPDARAAVAFSRDVLPPGGLFCMQDYTGPTRFQWTPAMLRAINACRVRLGGGPVALPSIDLIVASDPSEAVDSGAILPALAEIFPGASVVALGGLLYFAALVGAETDIPAPALHRLLQLDKTLAGQGLSLYSFALARKE